LNKELYETISEGWQAYVGYLAVNDSMVAQFIYKGYAAVSITAKTWSSTEMVVFK